MKAPSTPGKGRTNKLTKKEHFMKLPKINVLLANYNLFREGGLGHLHITIWARDSEKESG